MAPQRRKPKTAGDSAAGPAARTRAALRQQHQQEQQQQQAAADLAWLLLLQHASIRTQLRLVCRLLCCSKALAAAVAEHCAGQLDVPRFWGSQEAEQAVPWLRKHARLVRSLDLQTYDDNGSSLAAALMAAGPQTLALQSLKAHGTPTALPLLEQLPASHLTQLVLQEVSGQQQDRAAFVARVSAVLNMLTALHSLGLFRDFIKGPQQELSGLSRLMQLTSLHFRGPVADLQHVPPQLLALNISDAWRQPGQALELQRLAALTALAVSHLKEGDVLPPNLLRLEVDDGRSVQPLLGDCLRQLQQLHLRFFFTSPDISSDQLRQLSTLRGLSLHYHHVYRQPASAAAWSALPLQQLELHQASLSAPVCQHLAQLSGLTSLALQGCTLTHPGSVQQLAATLRQLSGLQQLALFAPQLVAPDTRTAVPSQGMQQLAQAVGSLKQLRGLDIGCFPRLVAAANFGKTLTGLTALTDLLLSSVEELSDEEHTALVAQLPLLRRGWGFTD